MQTECPECGLPTNGRSCRCGWTASPAQKGGNPFRFGVKIADTWIDKQCAFNDHGHRCDSIGWMASTTHGSGPWYCRKHFDMMMSHAGAECLVGPSEHAEWVSDIKTLIAKKTVQK